MKVEIDIDMSRIDYDSINAQIKEKLDSLTPSDIFKRYYKTDDDISRYIEKHLDEGSQSYMVNQGWWSNDNAKQNIRNIAERIITDKMKKICDDIFATMTDEELQKLVYDIFPNIFVQAMYDSITYGLYNSEERKRFNMQDTCRNIVDQAFRDRAGY